MTIWNSASVAMDKIEASPLVQIEFPSATHHKCAKAWIQRLPENPIIYTDAVSFAVMEAMRCTEALTYDRHFQNAGF